MYTYVHTWYILYISLHIYYIYTLICTIHIWYANIHTCESIHRNINIRLWYLWCKFHFQTCIPGSLNRIVPCLLPCHLALKIIFSRWPDVDTREKSPQMEVLQCKVKLTRSNKRTLSPIHHERHNFSLPKHPPFHCWNSKKIQINMKTWHISVFLVSLGRIEKKTPLVFSVLTDPFVVLDPFQLLKPNSHIQRLESSKACVGSHAVYMVYHKNMTEESSYK